MPTYPHLCHACNYEWEAMYSIKANPPTICPACGVEGKVERLIAGGSGRGICELTGKELTAKLEKDAQDMLREMPRNERLLANIIGEDKHHQNELSRRRY